MKIILQFLMSTGVLFCATVSHAYTIRNTYQSELICTKAGKPQLVYRIPANKAKNYNNVPSLKVKEAGKYHCKTKDQLYTSTCSVSEIQETATFDTNDGSASCSTPLKSSS